MLKLTPYSTDANSSVLYLSNPQPIAVQFQMTEFAKGLLDVEFLLDDNGHEEAKFLLRIEGTREEMRVLGEAILFAMKEPRTHPFPGDLFEDALRDRSDAPEPLRSFYSSFRRSKTKEVDKVRARSVQTEGNAEERY